VPIPSRVVPSCICAVPTRANHDGGRVGRASEAQLLGKNAHFIQIWVGAVVKLGQNNLPKVPNQHINTKFVSQYRPSLYYGAPRLCRAHWNVPVQNLKRLLEYKPPQSREDIVAIRNHGTISRHHHDCFPQMNIFPHEIHLILEFKDRTLPKPTNGKDLNNTSKYPTCYSPSP